ncbi:glutathione S-transferase family protein [Rhodobacter sp. KR11]|uniref:glutathione S-transferase family protein n=1 Tax=Rhodobacter sp. KR11 TaxID=2974588 RepID=UPI002222BB9B|nr:glutathione S-transferase family protein [Rhodobacter sp. KR11]MCW1918238.1 glutathione S-transferase family protein [Rhodobacter sp. KR11]
MLTLIHAPNSRSTRVLHLIHEMGIADRIRLQPVGIIYRDGSGAPDPANPHPEGKVPALIHDGTVITESGAIMLYLTALFPDSGLAPAPGTPARGAFLTWLFWYQGVMEPVMMAAAMGIHHPGLDRNFRGIDAANDRIRQALTRGAWLCGDTYTAADLICSSAYTFFPQFVPDEPAFRDWVARCASRPALAQAKAQDAEMSVLA